MTLPDPFDLTWDWSTELDLGPGRLFQRPVSVLQQGWTLERTRCEWSIIARGTGNTLPTAGFNDHIYVALQWTMGDPAPFPLLPSEVPGVDLQDEILWWELHPTDVGQPLFNNGPGLAQPRGGAKIDSRSRRRNDFSQGIVWLSVEVLPGEPGSSGALPDYYFSYAVSRLARIPVT